jgi:hypothetical protein
MTASAPSTVAKPRPSLRVVPDAVAAAAGERRVGTLLHDGDDKSVTVTIGGEVLEARRGFVPGWKPSVGDRVVVEAIDGASWVVGVLEAREPASLVAADGTSARVVGAAIELRDAEGRLVARAGEGRVAVSMVEALEGDLVLRAPAGRVRIEAGLDLELEAARDVTTKAARDRHDEAARELTLTVGRGEPQLEIGPKRTELRGEALALGAKALDLAAGTIALAARAVSTKAYEARHDVSRWEVHAGRAVERARESVREVSGLAQARLGRATTVVSELWSMRAKRTEVASTDDTVIDGRKVLLG